METHEPFEAAWRQMKPRIERLLRSRGAAADVVDDVVQETSIKLLHTWDRVDPRRPLWPLARTIALNCLTDHFRKATAEPAAEVPDEPALYDVEEHGLARAQLSAVVQTMRSLRPKDRSVLLAEVGESNAWANDSAHKMARLRARQRLAQALERSAAVFSAVQVGCRRTFTWLQQQGAAGAEVAVPAIAGAAVAVSVALSGIAPTNTGSNPVGRDSVPRVMAAAGERVKPTPHRTPERTDRPDGSSAATATQQPAAPASRAASSPRPAREQNRPQETKVAEVGGNSAKTGGDERYRYVVVCTDDESGDGRDLTVAYGEEGSEEESMQDHCG
ncbi:MAG: sigma-70 family RNA polymerase sigma factor [Actinomycetota bacterium]|nr:sigma-70 family RNA polymerase sigma factor [Actinomycetota bacterium]